jgi:hypothetical protein
LLSRQIGTIRRVERLGPGFRRDDGYFRKKCLIFFVVSGKAGTQSFGIPATPVLLQRLDPVPSAGMTRKM